ncbi:MAG: Fic family protein [Thermoleophilia bacterium]|nr:Fic family protein [Thermoleophilia bacterium]
MRQVALIQSAEASNAIENIHAPRKRIEELVNETTEPRDRSEQEIAGYRYALDLLHVNATTIDFEPKYVEQIHGALGRYTGDNTTGHWKKLDNEVEEEHPDGTKVVRFVPVSANETPAAMAELHDAFNEAERQQKYHHLLLTAAYVLDFLVIHPFRDGNGRMSRLITLWLLYLGDYEVGRYVSLEKLIEESKESYYEALAKSTAGWHDGKHDLRPWTEYFLGIVNAAYGQFESRTSLLAGRGSKQLLVKRFIASNLSNEFNVAQVREAAPGVSDSTIEKVLSELRKDGVIERKGSGRGTSWLRLKSDFLDDHDSRAS